MSPALLTKGQRVRLHGARFGAGFVEGVVLDVRQGIARVHLDRETVRTEALVYESLGGIRATFRGSVVVLDGVELIELADACDPDDEPTYGEVA